MSGHNHSMETPMIPKPEQAHWALQEAAIRAEINQAKANVDLLRMANAVARLDKLHSEIEASGKSTSVIQRWMGRKNIACLMRRSRPPGSGCSAKAALASLFSLRCCSLAWRRRRSLRARSQCQAILDQQPCSRRDRARHRPSAAALLPTLHEVVSRAV